MTDLTLQETDATASVTATPRDPVRAAFVESRQRWRHLVGLAADIAFETDSDGCFTFLTPDTVLGWPASALIGQPAKLLTNDDRAGTVLNPFCPSTEIRRHFSVMPLYDEAGTIIGHRGVGIDIGEHDAANAQIVGRLRRGEVLDHILSRVGHETETDSMMDAALWALVQALGAEGAAVVGSLSDAGAIAILHECGVGASAILPTAAALVVQRTTQPNHTTSPDGRQVLTVGCQTRFGANAGLVIWRTDIERPWDSEDTILAASAVGIVRMILEYAAFARDMAHQARTDPLTDLLNRRAFLEETRRTIARLDRESDSGTLMFIDLDGFKAINDQLGHATGDEVLVHFADLLKKLVRPSDAIARLGGDEFAVWLSSADYMTGAERADFLCKNIPAQMQTLMPAMPPALGVSIGIATRSVGSRESIEDLIRRADTAMYEVKRSGRNHWRVSLVDGN
jgi:diguanylate cyclase (GGDEF)-like protein